MKNKYKFASREEEVFAWYLDELSEAELIKQWYYEPYTYLLSKKVKMRKGQLTLLGQHVYTPDFAILFKRSSRGLLWDTIQSGNDLRMFPFITNEDNGKFYSIIETKGSFDRYNMTRLFKVQRKWVFMEYGVYVQGVIPVKFFEATFVPVKYLLTPTGRKRHFNYKPRTLKQFIDARKRGECFKFTGKHGIM